MARPRRPIDPARRTRLLAEARLAFASSGFETASLVTILGRAEFSRSSFYYFFETKEALFDAAFEDGLSQLAELVDVPDLRSVARTEFWDRLLAVVRSLSRAGSRDDLKAVGVLFHLADAPDVPSLSRFRQQAQDWCRRAVRVGQDLGCVDPALPADLATDLAWSAAGALDRWFTARSADPSQAAELTEHVLRGTLAPRPTPLEED